MRVEALLLLGLAVFFTVTGTVYWFTSYEQAGTLMLIGSALLGLLPGAYYFWWSRRMEERTEDRDDAEVAEGAGTVAAFPGSSIWPFVLGVGLALTAVALVLGIWTAVPGIALVISALVGVTVESRRGGTV